MSQNIDQLKNLVDDLKHKTGDKWFIVEVSFDSKSILWVRNNEALLEMVNNGKKFEIVYPIQQ